jgi:hypothetical protein
MKHLGHKGNLRQKLVCFVGALLIFVAPLAASVCPGDQCALGEPKAAGECHSMGSPHDAESFHAHSTLPCCQLTQTPQATITPATEKIEVQPNASYVIVEARSLHSPTIRRVSDKFEVTFSPPDLQSLLCTLLL